MRSLLARAAGRIGLHGLILIVFGWLWCWIGVGVLLHPDFNPQLIHTYLPVWIRFTLWAGAGAASMVLAWWRGSPWAAWWRRPQAIGYAVLFTPPVERTISYSFALVTGGLQWLVGLIVWGSMSLAVVLFAVWPEPVSVGPNSAP